MKTILLNVFRKSYPTVAKILFVSILLLLFSKIVEGGNATSQKDSPTIPCVVFDDYLYLRDMGKTISNNLDVALEMARKDAALSLSRKSGGYFASAMVWKRFDSFDDNYLESICVEVTKNEEITSNV
ncbi:MAG: hypothetical protein J1F29_02045 [Lentimicrobiaceae bacterium]|nr:hypothetical protein [Lentimicrobiaceae bacterium]